MLFHIYALEKKLTDIQADGYDSFDLVMIFALPYRGRCGLACQSVLPRVFIVLSTFIGSGRRPSQRLLWQFLFTGVSQVETLGPLPQNRNLTGGIPQTAESGFSRQLPSGKRRADRSFRAVVN